MKANQQPEIELKTLVETPINPPMNTKGFNINFLIEGGHIVYQAFVIDEDNYYVIPTEFFSWEIDEMYGVLFKDLIKGTFEITYLKQSDFAKNMFPTPTQVEINNIDVIENFIEFNKLPPMLGIEIQIEEIF